MSQQMGWNLNCFVFHRLFGVFRRHSLKITPVNCHVTAQIRRPDKWRNVGEAAGEVRLGGKKSMHIVGADNDRDCELERLLRSLSREHGIKRSAITLASTLIGNHGLDKFLR